MCILGRDRVVFIDGERYPKQDSPFANPFKVGKDGTRDQVIALYEDYILTKLKDDKIKLDALKSLQGKTLGCWCSPEPCHGDILLRIVDAL